jgi:cyclophilin family peptidyl-prolyl cis-trans isomerase
MFTVDLHGRGRNSSKGFIYFLPESLRNKALVFGKILDGFDV